MEPQNEKDERVKIFLKIKSPKNDKNPYYQISKDKKSFLLENPKEKNEKEEKNEKYNLDKIFTDNNENSYIYEEIMLNCIKESLSNINFTFISYGDSMSENKEIIFGKSDCYENINSRGIFPRFLENYILKISGDKNLNENLALNVSYIMINGNNLIDISNFIGMESKEILNLNEDDLLNKFSIKINNNNSSLIHKVKKVPCEDIKDVLFFLIKFFDNLNNLQIEGSNLFLDSHFSFIIYINDNNGNIISTISFIILSCNDIYSLDSNNDKFTNYKEELNNTKEDIINYIKNINNQTIINKSKLISVLEKVSFRDNIKYRVIGTIYPEDDYYMNVKETLNFLLNCKKILSKKKAKFKSPKRKKSKSESEKKDDVIKDLESKIKVQEKKIEELNNLVDYKQIKSEMLKANYKKQIETLKETFNFNGDIENLLKNKNSKEKKFTREIREAVEKNHINENKIIEFENKINNIKEETKKILTIEGIKNTDDALVKIYTEIKEEKLAFEKQVKIKNEYTKKIEILKEKNKLLNQLLIRFKEENIIKDNIIKNLPNAFQENLDIQNIEIDEKKITNELKKYFKKEINDIEKNNIKENKIIIKKYENQKKQKENEMKKKEIEINEINKKTKMDHGNFINEIMELYITIDNLVTNYKNYFEQKKIFTSNINDIKNFKVYLNLKEEFDKIIEKYELTVNRFKFPILFSKLDEKGIERKKSKIIVYKNKEKEKRENHLCLKNKLNNLNIPINIIQENKYNIFHDIIKENEVFNKYDKIDLMNYYRKIKNKLYEIEEFNSKYIDYNKKYDKNMFQSNEENVLDLENKIEKCKNQIDEYSNKLINLQNIISTHKKMIEKLNMENILLKKKLNEKNLNDKISFGRNKNDFISNFTTNTNWKNNLRKRSNLSSGNVISFLNNIPTLSNNTLSNPNINENKSSFLKRPVTAMKNLKNNLNINNNNNYSNPYLRFPET